MKKTNVAIIGCGNIAGNYQLNDKLPITHVKAYLEIKNINIIAVSEKNKSKLLKFKKKWKIKHCYQDYEQMIKSHKIDIISICVPQKLHYKIIYFCYKNNIKKIFCEKPFCSNLKEIKKISKLLSKNFLITINYFRRWNEDLNFLRKKIIKKNYGIIKNVEFHYTKDLLNNGSHLIDLCFYFFGRPKNVVLLFKHKDGLSFDFIFAYKGFNVKFTHIPNVQYAFIEGKIFFDNYLIHLSERFQNYAIYKKIKDSNYRNLNTLKKIESNKTHWYLSIKNSINQLIKSNDNRDLSHSINDSLLLREFYEKIIKL